MASTTYNTIPSAMLNATYGPSAFEAGKYGNKFDMYANNTFGSNVVPTPVGNFAGANIRPCVSTCAGINFPFCCPISTETVGNHYRPCVSVCSGVNFPVCCPISTELVASRVRGSFPTTYDNRFGVHPTWAELARCYPSTWERTAFPSTYGYPSWAINKHIPSTWGDDNVPFNAWNNTMSTPNSTICNVAFRPSHPVEFYSLTNPIRVLDREGNRMLWLCYELKGFKPEEIACTFNKAERAVIVEATHEVKEGKEHHVMRKFYRKFVLPESFAKIDLSKVEIKSCLNNEGYLTIECQLPKMTAEEIASSPVLSKINEMPFYGRSFPAEIANSVRPVTVKIA